MYFSPRSRQTLLSVLCRVVADRPEGNCQLWIIFNGRVFRSYLRICVGAHVLQHPPRAFPVPLQGIPEANLMALNKRARVTNCVFAGTFTARCCCTDVQDTYTLRINPAVLPPSPAPSLPNGLDGRFRESRPWQMRRDAKRENADKFRSAIHFSRFDGLCWTYKLYIRGRGGKGGKKGRRARRPPDPGARGTSGHILWREFLLRTSASEQSTKYAKTFYIRWGRRRVVCAHCVRVTRTCAPAIERPLYSTTKIAFPASIQKSQFLRGRQ